MGISDPVSDAYRNRGLAPKGGSEWSYHRATLEYEPRSFAIDKTFTRIAIGTKAGTVRIAEWQDKDWVVAAEFPISSIAGGDARRGVRGLGFLGTETLVVGVGDGRFLSYERVGTESGSTWAVNETVAVLNEDSPPLETWEARFQRIVCFDIEGLEAGPLGVLAIGVTYGRACHVLARRSGKLVSWSALPAEWLAGSGGGKAGFPTWREEDHLADATLQGSTLWLLAQSGRLLGCDLAVEEENQIVISKARAFELRLHHERMKLRRVVHCQEGLAILATNEVTFLENSELAGKSAEQGNGAAGKGIEIVPTWHHVVGAINCTVCSPFPDEERVSLVIATESSGLLWIRVPLSPDGRQPHRRHGPEIRLDAADLPDIHPTFLRVFRRDGDGKSFIALASLEHDFIIQSLVDLKLLGERLREKTRSLDEGAKEAQEIWLETPPGVALWALCRRIELDLVPDASESNRLGCLDQLSPALLTEARADSDRPEAFQRESYPAFQVVISRMKPRDLYRLATKLIDSVLKALFPEPIRERDGGARLAGDAVDIEASLSHWMLRILDGAYRQSPAMGRDIARYLHNELLVGMESRRRAAETGSTELEPQRRRITLQVAFLRKWFLGGHTYGSKSLRLLDITRHNLDCGRNLDALVYLTRILRGRVDTQWCFDASDQVDPADVWDLVVIPESRVSFQVRTNGQITALDSAGKSLAWKVGADVPPDGLKRHHLAISEDRRALAHSWAERFRKDYRHGPYARSLVVKRLGESEGIYCMLFATKGWRRKGDGEALPDAESARLFALVLCVGSDGVEEVEIMGVDSRPVGAELYKLLDLNPNQYESSLHFVVGTRGDWHSNDRSLGRAPFFEGTVDFVGPGNVPEISLEESNRIKIAEQRRSVTKSAGIVQNPCWSMTTTTVGDRTVLWAGFRDGQIRCFWRDGSEERAWIELRGIVLSAGEGASDSTTAFSIDTESLHQSAPVWKLKYFEEWQVLVYGTAGGVVGALRLALPTHDEEALRIEEYEPRSATHDGVVQPLPHILHTQLESGISALEGYEDEGQRRLLVLTQEGIASIYAMGEKDPYFAEGTRVDRFWLKYGARAARVLEIPAREHRWDIGERLPALIVGAGNGDVYLQTLCFPLYTKRRQDATGHWSSELWSEPSETDESFGKSTTATLESTVGRELIWDWLRILDVGTDTLFRFSLWRELNVTRRKIFENYRKSDVERLLQDLKSYRDLLNRRADIVYGRRPIRRQPVKILWEEGSKVAHRLLELAFEHLDPSMSEQMYKEYLEIALAIDDLCNRWIGAGQKEEAKILAHSFRSLFHRTSVYLLAIRDVPAGVSEIRSFLLNNLVRRRLGSSQDRVLPLETLLVINTAIYKCLCQKRGGTYALRPVVNPGASLGFYDLMAMIGDLADSNYDHFVTNEPLSTELSKFYALSLLMVPDCSLVIGQIVSESRLLEHGHDFSHEILAHAERFWKEIKIAKDDPKRRGALTEFRDYVESRPSFFSHGEHAESGDPENRREIAWSSLRGAVRVLAQDGEEPPTPFTNAEVAVELEHVLSAAECLSDIYFRGSGFESTAKTEGWISWLDGFEGEEGGAHDSRYRYFSHSCKYLRKLRDTHRRIREHLGSKGGEREVYSLLDEASVLISRTLEDLQGEPALFEPQRTHYESLIRGWQRQVDAYSRDAAAIMALLDRFNRHVYQKQADQQMASVLELSLQVAPLWYGSDEQSLPLRTQVEGALQNHALIRQIFMTATSTVDHIRLAGTLLTAARDSYAAGRSRFQEKDRPPVGSSGVVLKEIAEILQTQVSHAGLPREALATTLDDDPGIPAPGSSAIWETICWVLASNVRRHCWPQAEEEPMRCIFDRSGKRNRLVFFCDVPFYETLSRDYKDVVDQCEEPGVELEKLVQTAGMLGETVGSHPESAGVGLFFLSRICWYSGMNSEVRLHQVGVAKKNVREHVFAVDISWQIDEGDEWRG